MSGKTDITVGVVTPDKGSTTIINQNDVGLEQRVTAIENNQGIKKGATGKVFVIWDETGYQYTVTYPLYYINGQAYPAGSDKITLDGSHLTLDRTDTFGLNASGAFAITGTPAEDPLAPTVDEANEIFVTTRDVKANTVEPEADPNPEPVANVVVYEDNNEFQTSSITGISNFDFTGKPSSGTKSIRLQGVIKFKDTVNVHDVSQLEALRFKLLQNYNGSGYSGFTFRFLMDNTAVSSSETIQSGIEYPGGKSPAVYETVLLDLNRFTFTSNNFNSIEITPIKPAKFTGYSLIDSMVLIAKSIHVVSSPSTSFDTSPFVLKASSGLLPVDKTGVVVDLDLSFVGNMGISLIGTVTELHSIKYSNQNPIMYRGVDWYIRNDQATAVLIKHEALAVIQERFVFSSPTEEDITIQPKEVLHFKAHFTEFNGGKIEFVGVVTDLGKLITDAEEKETIHDDDKLGLADSEDDNKTKFWKWSTIRAFFENLFEKKENKTSSVSGQEASNSYFPSNNGFTTWIKNDFPSWINAKATALVDGDKILIGDIEDSGKTKTRTFTQIKATLLTFFNDFYQTWILGINTIAGITYTIGINDYKTKNIFTNVNPVAFTVPTNAAVAVPIGTKFSYTVQGTGTVTVGGAGITFVQKNLVYTTGDTFFLEKIATDTWIIDGTVPASNSFMTTASDYYVDIVNGNDSTAIQGNMLKPYATIDAALAVVDTSKFNRIILLTTGTYPISGTYVTTQTLEFFSEKDVTISFASNVNTVLFGNGSTGVTLYVKLPNGSIQLSNSVSQSFQRGSYYINCKSFHTGTLSATSNVFLDISYGEFNIETLTTYKTTFIKTLTGAGTITLNCRSVVTSYSGGSVPELINTGGSSTVYAYIYIKEKITGTGSISLSAGNKGETHIGDINISGSIYIGRGAVTTAIVFHRSTLTAANVYLATDNCSPVLMGEIVSASTPISMNYATAATYVTLKNFTCDLKTNILQLSLANYTFENVNLICDTVPFTRNTAAKTIAMIGANRIYSRTPTVMFNSTQVLNVDDYGLLDTNIPALGTAVTYSKKTARFSFLPAYADDTAAAAGGIAVGYEYVNSTTGAIHRRLT